MIYRDECGFIAEVELLEEARNDKGTATTFRIVKTFAKPLDIPAEAIPKDGETFTAWKSHNIKYNSWRVAEF